MRSVNKPRTAHILHSASASIVTSHSAVCTHLAKRQDKAKISKYSYSLKYSARLRRYRTTPARPLF